jgi:sugar phosphate isomerase/epimerase
MITGPLSRRNFLVGSVAAGAAFQFGRMALAAAVKGKKVSPPKGWQIGCYTRPWADCDYRVAFDAIAEAGFKYAGLMTTKGGNHLVLSVETTPEEAAKVGEEVKKRGLRVPSVYGGDIPVAKSLEAGIAGLRKLIDNCAAVGCTNLLMGGVGDPKMVGPYYKAITECCDYAAEKGMGISVKPHGGTNSTGPQCRKLIESVKHPNFGLWYDAGNIHYYSDDKIDAVDDAATVDGLVVGLAVKDFRPPKDVEVTPGDGKVKFPAVMARLKKGGFTHGPLVIECLSPGDLPQRLAEAKKARAFVEHLVGQKTASAPSR